MLFFSPWLFDLSAGAQWQTASIVGIIIAVLSIAALAAFAVWEEWLNLIAGLALIVSPWLLGFQNSDAMTIDVVIGSHCRLLAAFEVWFTREAARGSRRATESDDASRRPDRRTKEKGDFRPPFVGQAGFAGLEPRRSGGIVGARSSPVWSVAGGVSRDFGAALIARGGGDSGNPDLPIAAVQARFWSSADLRALALFWPVFLADLAVASSLVNPVPFVVSDDEMLGAECGGNGRQIVRCRDISPARNCTCDRGKPCLMARTY